MRYCKENLKKLIYNEKTGKWYKRKGDHGYEYRENCKLCKEPFLSFRNKNDFLFYEVF